MIFNYLDNITIETAMKYYEDGYTFNVNDGHVQSINTPERRDDDGTDK